MKLRVYRNLYWANQGLINAAREIRELSKQSGLPRTELQELQAIIQETRATMNRLLAGRIDHPETGRPSRLVVLPFPREKTKAGVTSENNVSTNGWKSSPSGPRKDIREI